MTWQEIAEKHGTDKATHGYMPYYEEHFDRSKWWPRRSWSVNSILEIGCEKGNSARMWKELLPDAQLVFVDLFQEHPIPDIPGIKFIKGNQLDHELLYNIRNYADLDVVIDDGSHNSRDQLVTFWSLVGTSRLYVVEDLHCCNDELYRQGLPFEKTMLGQMKAVTFPYTHYLYDDKIAFIYAD